MPSFPREVLEAWARDRVERALETRGMDEWQRQVLQEESVRLQAEIELAKLHLSACRAQLRRVDAKLKRGAK